MSSKNIADYSRFDSGVEECGHFQRGAGPGRTAGGDADHHGSPVFRR
ncbi:hypothetical protein [Arthrobacter sp. H35-D1]|nr:hypothetical protein [Arthrobacter sp. H35-D1]MDJ0312785.1 hypothetical protein [Arthrobacter sp. H35-D1]